MQQGSQSVQARGSAADVSNSAGKKRRSLHVCGGAGCLPVCTAAHLLLPCPASASLVASIGSWNTEIKRMDTTVPNDGSESAITVLEPVTVHAPSCNGCNGGHVKVLLVVPVVEWVGIHGSIGVRDWREIQRVDRLFVGRCLLYIRLGSPIAHRRWGSEVGHRTLGDGRRKTGD